MVRDDYYVIAYQMLSYLYQCLKSGKDVDPKMLEHRGFALDCGLGQSSALKPHRGFIHFRTRSHSLCS